MERIRQALEQAEIDRQKAGVGNRPVAAGPVAPLTNGSAPVAEKPVVESGGARATAASPSAYVAPQDIDYTRTRCINISNKTLLDNHIVAGLPGHELQDTYRMLRTRIMREMQANDWNMIMVTGAHQGAGKSMTAINLAVAMSMDINHTVLLVDADLRQPSLHEYFNFRPETGLSDYLLHGAPVEDMLFHPNGLDRLVVLPGRERVENSAEMLGSPQAGRLAEELKTRYPDRIVILDAPPVLSSDDVVVTDRYVDAVLLVAEAGVTQTDELEESLRVLGNVPVLGTVLNKAPKVKAKARY